MFNPVQRRLAVLALAGLVATLACQQRQEVDEDVDDVDTLSTDVPIAPADTGMGAGAATGEVVAVAITNSMPHAMVVTVDMGSGAVELGTLQANETRSFPLEGASAGGQATLTATDSAATHSVSGTVDVGGGAPSWTIQ